jgi:hypothetical protein
MKLEDQVCSLEIAKKLKELGVGNASLWVWDKRCLYLNSSTDSFDCISAHTVAELGDYIERNMGGGGIKTTWYDKTEKMAEVFLSEYDKKYSILMNQYRMEQFKDLPKTEANARGKMLIYLIENKLIGK